MSICKSRSLIKTRPAQNVTFPNCIYRAAEPGTTFRPHMEKVWHYEIGYSVRILGELVTAINSCCEIIESMKVFL